MIIKGCTGAGVGERVGGVAGLDRMSLLLRAGAGSVALQRGQLLYRERGSNKEGVGVPESVRQGQMPRGGLRRR